MLSDYTLFHELEFSGIHTWGDIAFWIGIAAGLVGIFYIVILKFSDNRDRKKEHDVFIEDIKSEVNDMIKFPDKYISIWIDSEKRRLGDLGHFSFDTFDMYNDKYRYLFDKNTRDLIGKLNLAIGLFNKHTTFLRTIEIDIVFKHIPRDTEMKDSMDEYNAQLKRIKVLAKQAKKLIGNYKKPNWFKQKWNKLSS